MIEQHTTITTPDGPMGTFITRPDGDGPFPVIFFYMDAPGKREELHDMARRLATTGYYVMLPNLYYRQTDHFEMNFATMENRDRAMELMASINNGLIVKDTLSLIDWAENDSAADASNVGLVGYCMSGPFSMAVAAAYPDRVKAAASIYGVSLVTPAADSPHLGFAETAAELYIGCAELDEFVPPPVVEAITEALKASGNRGRVEIYPQAQHGFAFPDRGEDMYNKESAERHWERLHALFARNLAS